jgi:hypothetical protein
MFKVLRTIDRKRIYQEEVYRYEVRTQLDRTGQKKGGGKIWTFVNSAFFLWFLSSVVVGIISYSYAKWDKQRELEKEQRERSAIIEQEKIQRARKLDSEISSRLVYFFFSQEIRGVITVVGSEDSSVETEYNISVLLSEDGIMSLYNPNASNYKFGDPEYANRSLRSLLLELEAAVPSQEKNEISRALEQCTRAQSMFISAMRIIKELKKNGRPSYLKIDGEAFNGFCKSVDLERWGGVVIPVDKEIQVDKSH